MHVMRTQVHITLVIIIGQHFPSPVCNACPRTQANTLAQ
jgi:hypothetical protein